MPRHTLGVNVRWLIHRDLQEVYQIDGDGFPLPWSEEDFRRELKQKNTIGMIAEHGDKVVGFMIYRLHRDHVACHRLAVHSAYRRRGVGTALIRKLVSKLSAHRRPRLVFDMSDENLRGHVFLRAMSLKAVAVTYCGDECNYTFERRVDLVTCPTTGGSY